MSARLDELAARASAIRTTRDRSWTDVRARHAGRVQRGRLARRLTMVAVGAGLLVLACLRVADGAPVATLAEPAPASESLAVLVTGDAGFAHD